MEYGWVKAKNPLKIPGNLTENPLKTLGKSFILLWATLSSSYRAFVFYMFLKLFETSNSENDPD